MTSPLSGVRSNQLSYAPAEVFPQNRVGSGLRVDTPLKEVIQPHLPVRLPCYDLVPLTSHTFGGSLPCGLGDRLRVQPARVT